MNSLTQRISLFLKTHTPFDLLSEEELLFLSEKVKVTIVDKGEIIFERDTPKKPEVYLVKEGTIVLLKKEIVDFCNEGDLFGLRPLISEDNYHVTAKAQEDSIIYTFPLNSFKEFIKKNHTFNKFIIQSFAAKHTPRNVINPTLELEPFLSLEEKSELFSLQSFKYKKNPICCSVNTSVEEVAKTMCQNKIDAIIVTANEKPVGWIANKDLRDKIIVKAMNPKQTTAQQIMNKKVITAGKKLNIQEAQLLLLSNHIDYFCITEDGTENSKLIGVGSLYDIMVNIGSHPYVLFKEIQRCTQIKSLKNIREKLNQLVHNYAEQKLPMLPTLNIISQINTSLVRKSIDITLKKMKSTPPVKFTWISLGSQGRGEQLIPSDQDNGLIFENVSPEALEPTKDYFLKLADKIVKNLYKIGYDFCPAKMMANNPKWCNSLLHWQRNFSHWIEKPREKAGLLYSSVFFDFDCVYGNRKLTEKLSNTISKNIPKHHSFLRFLTKELISKPLPIGFFRQFIMEQDGDKKDSFNIKIRCIIPLIDAARILCLQHNIKDIKNTVLRYHKIAELEPHNAELLKNCADSFKILLRFRTEQAIVNKNSGNIIYLSQLSKTEKIKLKRSFKPIKEIKEILSIRFQTQQLF